MSKIVREYINKSVSMRDAWYECFGEKLPYGKCFCPFHDNESSPAAKVYEDHLTCFGECQRSFYPYDFLQMFRPDLVSSHSSSVLPLPENDKTPHVLCRFGKGLTAEQLLLRVLGL